MRMHTAQPTCLVRWMFQKGTQLVTCAVTRENGQFALRVASTVAGDIAITERFASGVAALQSHARIAAHLRDTGWTVVAYTDGQAAGRRYNNAAA